MRGLSRASLGVATMLAAGFPALAQDLSVHGLADARLVWPSTEHSWMDGGLGRLRYDGNGARDPDLRLDQILVDANLRLGSDALVTATFRYEPAQKTAIDILEAYGRYDLVSTGAATWSVKAGAFYPPISLENDGIGWTSPWTLTSSAINSWVGDELRAFGGETTVEWKTGTGAFSLTGALYGKNDPTGALIAARGWAFNDRPTGILDRVRIPDDVARAQRRTPPLYIDEFYEMDDRVGYYAGFAWRENRLGRLTYLHYDNRADPAARRHGQVAWRTEFDSIGIEAYLAGVTLFGQAMAGETEIDPVPAPRSLTRFQSAYVLAGKTIGPWGGALRADVFATQQPVGSNPDASERGFALTAAATWMPARWFQLTGEVLHIDSRRAQRDAAGLSAHSTETQVLVNARFLY